MPVRLGSLTRRQHQTSENAGDAPRGSGSDQRTIEINRVSMCARPMPSEEKANLATRAGSTHQDRLSFLEQAHEFLDKALQPALELGHLFVR